MIKDGEKKVTPKVKAEEILATAICVKLSYWTEDELNIDGMTEKEIEKVQEQMKKIADRLVKKLGYNETWGC